MIKLISTFYRRCILCFSIITIFFVPNYVFSAELTTELIPIDQLAKKFVSDVERIEVFYPKQFERLEMDWKKTSSEYIKQFEQEKDVEKKLNIFARLYYSWNNAHHRPISVKGIIPSNSGEILELPIRVFGQGLKFSQARFFVTDISTKDTPINIKVGDEIVSYSNIPILKYVLKTRDEFGNESPEAHINAIARGLAFQRRCSWGKIKCWKLDDTVLMSLKDVDSGEIKNVTLHWRERVKSAFTQPLKEPRFDKSEGWTFKPLVGGYGIDFDSTPDNEYGFYGVLQNKNQKFLLIKIFQFKDIAFVQSAIKEARKSDYEGVILDFGDNGGGNDSSMTLMAGLVGIKYQLELSSIRLVQEFKDKEVLKEATFGEVKAGFLFPYVIERNFNKMSPFTPFGCLDKSCPLKTSYTDYLEYWEKPSVQEDKPVKRISLITGRGTTSKTDSIAALFRSTKVGPIVGTPAVASSGTYYFRKEYLAQVGKKVVTVGVTFTPDFSLGTDCEEIQANPPQPNILIERTFENHAYYDTKTWIEAANAMMNWIEKPVIDRSCEIEDAKAKLKKFGLIHLERTKQVDK